MPEDEDESAGLGSRRCWLGTAGVGGRVERGGAWGAGIIRGKLGWRTTTTGLVGMGPTRLTSVSPRGRPLRKVEADALGRICGAGESNTTASSGRKGSCRMTLSLAVVALCMSLMKCDVQL